jgi:hypothetical protein
MGLASNIGALQSVATEGTSGQKRARELASVLADHPEYFSVIKDKHSSTYLYYPGASRLPDSVKSSLNFPVGQCVSMFHYDFEGGQCHAGQRVRVFRLSFVKSVGKVGIQLAQLVMESCAVR